MEEYLVRIELSKRRSNGTYGPMATCSKAFYESAAGEGIVFEDVVKIVSDLKWSVDSADKKAEGERE